jgi:hypothetical protein
MGENEELLRQYGLVEGPELPSEYSEFLEGLSREEIEVLVNLKQRLDEAGLSATTLKVSVPVL